MSTNKSKSTSKPVANVEPDAVASDASAEQRETVEPDVEAYEVYQPGPDEPVWTPVEPVAASDDAAAPRAAKKAPRAAGAKPARVGGKAAKSVTNPVTTEPAPTSDAPAPSGAKPSPKRATKHAAAQPDASAGTRTRDVAVERKGTLADERAAVVATGATEPNAATPSTTKRKLQKFIAERAEQRAQERAAVRAGERAAEVATDRANDVVSERAEDHVADRAIDAAPGAAQHRADDGIDQQWDAIPGAPLANTLQPMEEFLTELGTLSVAELVKRHIEAIGKAPRIKSRPWLVRKLGWVEQTKRYGGLSIAAKKRLEQLMSEIELPIPTPRAAKPNGKPPKSADDMPLGTRIERKWHGKLIVAQRVEGGWLCEGITFRSLSAAAKAVSGSHVSGPAFFGIWKSKGGAQ